MNRHNRKFVDIIRKTGRLHFSNEQKTVEPEETKTFEITWLGIGDQYIEDGKPKIVFEKPTYAHREQTVPSIYFWEKII